MAQRMASIKYLSDLPDPVKEIAKCREFLTGFRDSVTNEAKYITLLVCKHDSLEISQFDSSKILFSKQSPIEKRGFLK